MDTQPDPDSLTPFERQVFDLAIAALSKPRRCPDRIGMHPDHAAILILALAQFNMKAAGEEIKRQLAAAEFRGGAATCAAFAARRATSRRLAARARAAVADGAYQSFRAALIPV